ncbi:MAG TPA: BTAD domain-containing putative transcriptional regulator [Ilumatobacteraceae bacterium]|nr:BTAD domain-containing putative transcriptional regulator [Ilumatobacteraceae bacterium]
MDFRILGPLEVVGDDGRAIEVRGAKVRLLLAVLIVRAPRVVSAATLMDVLWRDDPPRSGANALQAQISKLRRLFTEADGPTGGDLLRTHPTGYSLSVDSDHIDAGRFSRLADAGRDLQMAGNLHVAVETFNEALSLWRGAALDEFEGDDAIDIERVRLGEDRLACLEDRLDAELALGRHDALIGELEASVTQNPGRERLWAQLMTALYRAGRQTDALAAFKSARTRLIDEFGIEPGPALHAVELAILEQTIELPATSRPDRPPPTNIHPDLAACVGREAEIADIVRILDDRRLVTLVGPGGVGKTRVAIEAATRARARWPDGSWLIELDPLTGDGSVVRALSSRFASRLGGENSQLDRDAPLLDQLVAGLESAQTLIVLDNCEHVLDEAARVVDRLVRQCPGVRVLATSRQALGITGEAVRPLDPLLLDDAIELFATRAADASGTFEIDDVRQVVSDICERLDQLPLALELAAARTRAFTPEHLLTQLNDHLRVAPAAHSARPERHKALRSTVEWSYNLLFDDERRLFARLSVFAGSFTRAAAEAVCSDEQLAGDDLVDALVHLVDKSLLTMDPVAGRFRLLQTVAEFAAERLEATSETSVLRDRHLAWMADFTDGATDGIRGRQQRAWFDALHHEGPNLRKCRQWALTDGDPVTGLRVATNVGWYAFVGARVPEPAEALIALSERATHADATLRCRAAMYIGLLGHQPDQCLEHALRAVESARLIADPVLFCECAVQAAMPLAARHGRIDEALALVAEARRALTDVDDPWGLAHIDAAEGMIAFVASDLTAAAAAFARSAAAYHAAGDPGTAGLSELRLTEIEELAGRFDDAKATALRALRTSRDSGLLSSLLLTARLSWFALREDDVDQALALGLDALYEAHQPCTPPVRAGALLATGAAHARAGDHEIAAVELAEAVAVYERFGLTRLLALAQAQLGDLAGRTGDVDAARDLYRSAVRRAMAIKMPWLTSHALVGLARTMLAVDDAARARAILDIVADVNAAFAIQATEAEASELVLLGERAGRAPAGPIADATGWDWAIAEERLVVSFV